MTTRSMAWKGLERRICRALGAERRPSIERGGWSKGSDDDGSAWCSVEVKRTQRYQLRAAWIEQARAHAKASGRPWVIVMAEHFDRRPLAVLDFYELVELCEKAGRIPERSIAEYTRDTEKEENVLQETPTPQPTDPPPDDGGEEEGSD